MQGRVRVESWIVLRILAALEAARIVGVLSDFININTKGDCLQ
jgi:hypothetical protein